MRKIKCNRTVYRRKPVDQLDNFAGEVEEGIYVLNPLLLPAPPLTQAAFHLLITTYDTTRAAYTGGGKLQKGAFDNAKAALIAGLDATADYVDEIANGLESTTTAAGYTATKGTYSSAVKPGQAVNVSVKRGIAKQLISKCGKLDGVTYGAVLVEGGPLPEDVVISADGKLLFGNLASGPLPLISGLSFDFTPQRIKTWNNLTHDVTYYIYYYYVNSAGVGQLSEPVSIVCW